MCASERGERERINMNVLVVALAGLPTLDPSALPLNDEFIDKYHHAQHAVT